MPAERVSIEKRAQVLASLFEGVGVNATARITGVAVESILRTLTEAAAACEAYHDKHVKGLAVARIEIDEQWAYVAKHKERMSPEERASERQKGDCWLWCAIAADEKAVLSWKSGKRSWPTRNNGTITRR